ncbi:hypothetical protein DL93DRAFT_2072646 [Clavulina sp. PMI_390]|nr:hypothetical protein DL93DRAFT_2072646 [Clavulina sp. PMI_390]
MKEFTEAWVGEHFRGCFEAVHYTGQFERKEFLQTLAGLKAVNKKLEKIEVLQSIGAVLLVDDSLENATTCVTDPKPVPVLLFGPWPWNRHRSYARNEPGSLDFLSYDERRARGLDSQADAISDSELPNGMQRAQNWDEVVQAVKKSFPA